MMLKKLTLTTYILIGIAALTGVAAYAQNTAAPAPQPKGAGSPGYHQFDVGGSFYQTFVSSTTGMGLKQTPSDGMGGLFEGRYLVNPLLGIEMAVGFHAGDQAYAPIPGACKLTCQNPPVAITASQIEATINYVPSYQFGRMRLFGVGGIGVVVTIPGATPLGNITSIRGAYVYGGGLDYDISNHFGIRGQYRGTFYHAPNISAIYPATGQFTQIMMPMGGVYYRF
jgi:opacity protein-like surface antigen